jgi:hypothetical protein
MNQIDVRLNQSKSQFLPMEWIEGRVSWNLKSAPRDIEIRLLWFTEGKGTTDLNVVESLSLGADSSRLNGDAPFRFQLPSAPHSFSGALISLLWAVEAVPTGQNIAGRAEFVLSPDGKEIELEKIERPQSELERRFKSRLEGYSQRHQRGSNAKSEPMDSGNPSPWS